MFVIEFDGWDMTEHFHGNIDSLVARIRAGDGKETLGVHIQSYDLSLRYYLSIYEQYQSQME